MRIGQGLDFHIFIEDERRPLMIGGVEIPGSLALKGHSDADVLLHALADAILGACGQGDIGQAFPDNDQSYKDLDSNVILSYATRKAEEKGLKIGNIDVTLIGEKPKFAPYRETIVDNLARLLKVNLDCIGLKATTTEKMGALGRAEGLGCSAIVLLLPLTE